MRTWILVGSALTALGLAVAATAPVPGTAPLARITTQQTIGGVLVVAGWALLAWSIHRFGRGN